MRTCNVRATGGGFAVWFCTDDPKAPEDQWHAVAYCDREQVSDLIHDWTVHGTHPPTLTDMRSARRVSP